MKELASEIGSRVKELREAPDGLAPNPDGEPALTAADVASAARELGIPWRISTVRAIELGDRKIWAVEFLLLGEIFRRAWARKGLDVRMPLANFLPQERVVAGAVVVDPEGLRLVVSGRPFPPEALEIAGPELLPELPARAARLDPRWIVPMEDLPPSLDLRQLGREARSEAEQKLARKFGVPPEAIVIAAHARWGMGLTNVRDRELGDVAGLSAETVRTKRGRVTLRLGKELEPDIDAVRRLLTEAGRTDDQRAAGADEADAIPTTVFPNELVGVYERLVSQPWAGNLPDLDRLWIVTYPLARPNSHRKLLDDLKRVTEEAGHRWEYEDLFLTLGGLAPHHGGVEERWRDPKKSGELEELIGRIAARLQEVVVENGLDGNAVVAVDAVGSFVPFSRFAEVLQRVGSLVPGRLLAFLPRPEEDGPFGLLLGSNGWEILQETLNTDGSGP
jgi:hypothetical protein